jgi:hypothetical protein
MNRNSKNIFFMVTMFLVFVGSISKAQIAVEQMGIPHEEHNCSFCEKMDFSFPKRTCVGEKIYFEPSYSFCKGTPIFQWDFGEGTGLTSNFYHTYNYPGVYIVSFVVPAINGCPERKVTQNITIAQCPEFDCADHHDEDGGIPCAITATFSVIKGSSTEIALQVMPAGGSGSYQYTWSVTGQGTPPTIIQGQGTDTVVVKLNSPNYPYQITVLIKDEKGCTVTKIYSYAGN